MVWILTIFMRQFMHELDVRFCQMMANDTIVEQPMIFTNSTYVLTNHTIDFIKNAVGMGAPFFHVTTFVHVHTPLFTAPQFANVSEGGFFGDNLVEMDWAAGQIINTIDELGIADNTLIIFISDNGPFAGK